MKTSTIKESSIGAFNENEIEYTACLTKIITTKIGTYNEEERESANEKLEDLRIDFGNTEDKQNQATKINSVFEKNKENISKQNEYYLSVNEDDCNGISVNVKQRRICLSISLISSSNVSSSLADSHLNQSSSFNSDQKKNQIAFEVNEKLSKQIIFDSFFKGFFYILNFFRKLFTLFLYAFIFCLFFAAISFYIFHFLNHGIGKK